MSPECSAASACEANPKQIAATHPQRDNIFQNLSCPGSSGATIQVPSRDMHLSARSELKTELADSWIKTKLPINEVGLLHVCLTDVSRFTRGCAEMSIMQEGPLCAPV